MTVLRKRADTRMVTHDVLDIRGLPVQSVSLSVQVDAGEIIAASKSTNFKRFREYSPWE